MLAKRVVNRLDFTMKLLVVAVVSVAVALPNVFGQANPQPGGPDAQAGSMTLPGARYEAATIKPNQPSEVMWVKPSANGRFSAVGMSLKNLVCMAYGVMDFQISGSPEWLASNQLRYRGQAG
jgi:hypothetical protein